MATLIKKVLRCGHDFDVLPAPLLKIAGVVQRHRTLQSLKRTVKLIQGAQDQSIRPKHAEILASAAPDCVELWMVPGAGHTMAWTAAHQEFEARVTAWFEEHQHAPGLANELRSATRRCRNSVTMKSVGA